MEQYIVSARKYRPSSFDTVVGQQALTSTLKNAIATKRLAHAYLFCGSRGVGKTSCARIFAKTINCKNPTADGEACNECDSCKAFNEGVSMNIIEMDAASHNGVDDMRQLIDQVQVPPSNGKYRVFIIDEVHMLSTASFNAFLKTLEEPPSYVIFILATTEKHKIIPTILSRCQIYDFNRITIQDMVTHLSGVAQQEGITADPAALSVIARQADGAMRDALSIFDQVAASSRGNITYKGTIESLNVLDSSYYARLVTHLAAGEVPQSLLIFHEIRRKGFDAQFFINGLGQYMRDLMLAFSPDTLVLLDTPDEVKAEMAECASRLTPKFLYGAMDLCNTADLNYRQSSNKQLLIELTLIKIAQLQAPVKVDAPKQEMRPIEAAQPSQNVQPTPPAQPKPQAAPQQAAAPHQPVAAVPRADIPRPAVKASPTFRVGTLSIHGDKEKETNKVTAPKSHKEVTQSGIDAAWSQFIEAHNTEVALINVMRVARPQLRDDGKCVLTLSTSVEGQVIAEAMENILLTMRSALENDDFSFTMDVTGGELPPKFWPERKVFDYALENYSEFRSFAAEMDLKLL